MERRTGLDVEVGVDVLGALVALEVDDSELLSAPQFVNPGLSRGNDAVDHRVLRQPLRRVQ